MPSDTYARFVSAVREIDLAHSAEALLDWDQEVLMPKRAAEYRAAQTAFLAGLAHEKLTGDGFGDLLAAVEREADADPLVSANVRELRRDFDRSVKVPTWLVQEIARTTTLAKQTWQTARKNSDFASFAPTLEKVLDLKRQMADHIGWKTEPYDALMDEYEPGAKSADVQALFDELRKELVPLVRDIAAAPRQPDLSILSRVCPQPAQAAFGRRVAEAIGFEFDAGRLDVSTHPFCSGTCPNDVRLTTRYDEKYLPMSLFGVLHEAGHGLYEQGLEMANVGTPMGKAVSLGIHESQSRMWENMVGRSREFWQHFLPALLQQFPALAGAGGGSPVTLDAWVFAINAVRPSLIRVEADEVTYGLHIMLRFDLERRMIAGKLAVRDVPAAWNDGMKALLGIAPPDDAQGCLQDIHWSMGSFGYFPTYQLGNLYAAQLFAAARRALPDLPQKIAGGEFRTLREWLRTNIHRHGKRHRATELLRQVTGQAPTVRPYMDYLNGKFRPLYGLK